MTAALVPVPPYTRPGADGVLAHFAELARHGQVPLVVYHVPRRTGQDLEVSTLRRLAGLTGVAGIKYAVGGVDEAAVVLLADRPAGFAVLAGDDRFLVPMLALGAAGGILASAHVCTAGYVGLVEAWRAGERARVWTLGGALALLSQALFAAPNPAVIKGVLYAQGRIPSPAVRLPLIEAEPALVAEARQLAARVEGVLAR